MDEKEAKKEIERLRKEINHHDYRYYVLNKPIISDHEYDRLYKRLKDLEQQFPGLITPDSPTQRVGGMPLKKFNTVQHRIKMLSLDNTYNKEEVREFNERVIKSLGRKVAYEVTLKVDGVAVSLHYRKGRFVLGATRGDGIKGDDITENLKTIRSIPLKILSTDRELLDIEVRGEVFLPKIVFDELNKEREKQGLSLFANPRNAAAGTLKLLDSREVAKRGLDIFIHTVPIQPGPRHCSHYDIVLMNGSIKERNSIMKSTVWYSKSMISKVGRSWVTQ